jgi:conjugative relaxase-like TrwC/TraI family protein
VLRPVGARSTVAKFDLTFSAPKSVSVLFAVADDEIAGAALAAHERAVDAALANLEREACWTRRGRDGVEPLRGEGFVAASYRHRMSRAGDPQLHTHVVVANMTLAAGRYTALDAHGIYEHKSAGGAVYRACSALSCGRGCRGSAGGQRGVGCSRSTGSPSRCCATSPSGGSKSRSRRSR